MILSNEPGFYDTDKGFGIRIENLLIVEPRQTEHHFAGKQFLGFAKLTHVPIQRSLLEPSLLSADDVDWLDRYHAQIRDKVLPRVSGRVREWLLRATEPLGLVFARPAAAAATAAASA
jgi:Xaa-Pro aminopeptidase